MNGHRGTVRTVSFIPDGRTIASGSMDATIRLWDTASGKEVKRIKGVFSPIRFSTFSPDGKAIASVDIHKIISLWDAALGRRIRIFTKPNDCVNVITFSPDSKTIASGNDDSSICLWDVLGRKKRTRPIGYKCSVTSATFSPDGKLIVFGTSDGIISLWDAVGYKEINQWNGHTDSVRSIIFSPCGKTIATAGTDGMIRLWDVATGSRIIILNINIASVLGVIFSPDGKTIASWRSDYIIRLWDVETGKETKILKGYEHHRNAYFTRPNGELIDRSNYNDGILLWNDEAKNEEGKKEYFQEWPRTNISPDGNHIVIGTEEGWVIVKRKIDKRIIRQFIGDANGNWLSIDEQKRVLRYDDGTLLKKKNKTGKLTPMPPPKQKGEGKLEIISHPRSLKTKNGMSTPFEIELQNTGQRRLFWINIKARYNPNEKNCPLVFYPPKTRVILEPGERVKMQCRVSALSKYNTSEAQEAVLNLETTTAYPIPVPPVTIPVEVQVPILQIEEATLQKEGRNILLITMRNIGNDSLTTPTQFNGNIENITLDTVTKSRIGAGEKFLLSFTIPSDLVDSINSESRLTLTAKKTTHPIRVWEFNDYPITIYSVPITKTKEKLSYLYPIYIWGLLLGALFILIAMGLFYYVRVYRNSLVIGLSKKPETFTHLSIFQLPPAFSKLTRIHKLETILIAASVPQNLLNHALDFLMQWDVESRIQYLTQHLDAKYDALHDTPFPIYKLHMSSRFMLNMDRCLLALPPKDMDPAAVLFHIQKTPGVNYLVCVIISLEPHQQEQLRKTSTDRANMLVVPDGPQLTQLFLSTSPLELFAHIIAQQVKVTRISPYQTKGGVARPGVFFGREQLLAHIIQREPANYFLVGGRQLGKSSLLKALYRHYADHPAVSCHYLVLSGVEILPHLAMALKLPHDASIDQLTATLSQGPTRLFLVDEADLFILNDARNGHKTLQHFRSLSETGQCHFIFAGFWGLYHAAALDYQSPLKNFGETLTIGALEPDACRDLAVKPMELLGFSYQSPDDVEMLIHESGRRPNLIAIVCNEILKTIGITHRVITPAMLDQALKSDAVIDALSGWESLSGEPEADRLDRIVIYATIQKETFTQTELMDQLTTLEFSPEPEALRRSLARLVLAFILEHTDNTYRYRVPLFKKHLQPQAPQKLLEAEIKAHAKGY